MRLEKIQEFLEKKGIKSGYTEEDGCGSLDFEYRGLFYYIWEFPDGEGAESNVRSGGRQEEFDGDYEEKILEILKGWK